MDVHKYCTINKESESLLKMAMDKRGVSVRAYDRILKVSITIVDMEKLDSIFSIYISEANQYCSLDRSEWFI